MVSVSGLMCFCLLPRLEGLAGLNCYPAQPLQKTVDMVWTGRFSGIFGLGPNHEQASMNVVQHWY